MQLFTVSFFGHRQLEQSCLIEKELEKIIRELLRTKEYIQFLVGRSGAFDLLAAATIRRCRSAIREDNSVLILVLPYLTAEYRNNTDAFHAYYDEVEIGSTKVHFKAAYQARNRSMVERSDLVICAVEHPFGGAYQTLQYAQRLGIPTINLAPVPPSSPGNNRR